ncbi:MAG: nucleoside triphosphate pyrophosphohydrolase family protein [Marinobacterium sp.]|nr:nucleoside triphosphate pyrophosphohydrolase family protein [Marinobacterium sp.]
MSDFQLIKCLNEAFGNSEGDISNPDWQRLGQQEQLIIEEVGELKLAADARNMSEVRDAIADILTTVYGYAHLAGIAADADLAEVTRSNMTKLCFSREDLEQTVAAYSALGVKTVIGGTGPWYVKSACDQTGNDGKFYPEGKFLKNVRWEEPVLD